MAVESLDDEPEKPGRSLGVKIALGVGVFLGLVLATAGGFWTYHTFLLDPEAPAPVVVRRVTPAPTPVPESKPVAVITPAPTPAPAKEVVADATKQVEETAAKAAALPGKLIAKAQSAMDAKRQSNQEQIDAVATGNFAATGKPSVVVASKATSTRQPTPTPTPTPSPTPTPDPKAAQASTGSETRYAGDIDFSPGASDEFKKFVSEANISAVLQGTPARAMINNRRVRSGEFADAKAGFIFDRLDTTRRLIYFKDRLGAVVVRRY